MGSRLNSESLDSCPPAHLKLGRFPALTHVLPPNSNFRFCPSMSLAPPRLHSRRYPPWLCLDHSHCPVLAPATLAALPSTRAIPDRDVFYVAFPKRSIETHSLPTLARCFPRSFTFYVAYPIRSIPSLATCSMSLDSRRLHSVFCSRHGCHYSYSAHPS